MSSRQTNSDNWRGASVNDAQAGYSFEDYGVRPSSDIAYNLGSRPGLESFDGAESAIPSYQDQDPRQSASTLQAMGMTTSASSSSATVQLPMFDNTAFADLDETLSADGDFFPGARSQDEYAATLAEKSSDASGTKTPNAHDFRGAHDYQAANPYSSSHQNTETAEVTTTIPQHPVGSYGSFSSQSVDMGSALDGYVSDRRRESVKARDYGHDAIDRQNSETPWSPLACCDTQGTRNRGSRRGNRHASKQSHKQEASSSKRKKHYQEDDRL